MSLRVWLPLNGDLHNQGLDDIGTPSNNAFILDSNGKIGQCYRNTCCWHLSEEILSNSWSVCLWVKLEESPGKYNNILFAKNISESTSCQIYLSIISNTKLNLGINGTAQQYQYSYNFEPLQWYHLCATYDGSTYSMYINGELVKSGSNTTSMLTGMNNFCIGSRSANVNGTSMTGQSSNRCFNDFRLYDHALSAKEVKEISKALVLHYPLDDRYIETTTNMARQTAIYTTNTNPSWDKTCNGNVMYYPVGWSSGYNGGVSEPTTGYHAHWVLDEDYGMIMCFPNLNDSIGKKGRWLGISCTLLHGENITPSTKYTISFDAKTDTLGMDVSTGIYYKLNSSATSGFRDGLISRRPTAINNWQHFSITYTRNNTYDSTNNTNNSIYLYGNSQSVEGTIWVKNVQVEINDHDTPYVMGETSRTETLVYDTSGYSYNGTKIGDLTCSTDTPRYNASTTIATTSSHIVTPTITPTDFANSYTFSWWQKHTSGGNNIMAWGFSNGNRLNLYQGTANLYWNTGDGSSNPFGISGSLIMDDTWHHVVVTGDGTNSKLYIDGEFKANATTYRPITGTTIYISGWANAASYSFNGGSLSDFRLYATALSADDIKELYDTGMSIDNKQNIHTYELDETYSTIGLKKTGVLNAKDIFTEDDSVGIYKSGLITANQFYER